jgi:hypothetical protein
MGLDSRDHTRSGPSGSGFFYTTSFGIAAQNERIWHVGQITAVPVSRGRRKRRIPS